MRIYSTRYEENSHDGTVGYSMEMCTRLMQYSNFLLQNDATASLNSGRRVGPRLTLAPVTIPAFSGSAKMASLRSSTFLYTSKDAYESR